jgi:hypothetical protein
VPGLHWVGFRAHVFDGVHNMEDLVANEDPCFSALAMSEHDAA